MDWILEASEDFIGFLLEAEFPFGMLYAHVVEEWLVRILLISEELAPTHYLLECR